MKTYFYLAALSIFASTAAFGAEGVDLGLVNPDPKNTVTGKSFIGKGGRKVHVLVRDDGHVKGRPYLVEFRPDCTKSQLHWQKLNPINTQSACKIKSGSLKFDSKTETVSFSYYEVDADDYNKRSLSSQVPIEPKCTSEATEYTVKLSELCPASAK